MYERKPTINPIKKHSMVRIVRRWSSLNQKNSNIFIRVMIMFLSLQMYFNYRERPSIYFVPLSMKKYVNNSKINHCQLNANCNIAVVLFTDRFVLKFQSRLKKVTFCLFSRKQRLVQNAHWSQYEPIRINLRQWTIVLD